MSSIITPFERESVNLILTSVMEQEFPNLIACVKHSNITDIMGRSDVNQSALAFLSWSESVDRSWLSDRALRAIENVVLVSRKAESPCVDLRLGGIYMTASHRLSLVAACSKRCFVISSDGVESSHEYDGSHSSDHRREDWWFWREIVGKGRRRHKDIVSFLFSVMDSSSQKE